MAEYIDKELTLFRMKVDCRPPFAVVRDMPAEDVAPVQRWIPVTERMPDEHESLFAPYKDTDKWCNGMFMTISDPVIVCAEYENGERMEKTANATDGIWKVKDSFYPCRVTHWMPLPELPRSGPNGKV